MQSCPSLKDELGNLANKRMASLHFSLGCSFFEKNDYSLNDYTKNVNSHFVGKYINNSINMAKQIYSGEIDLLDTIKMSLNQMGK